MLKYLLISILAMSLAACFETTSLGSQDDDPVAQDFPLVYVKRSVPKDEDGERLEDNLTEPTAFFAGAGLFLRERASATAAEVNLLAGKIPAGAYDIKDLSVSYDGQRLLFAMLGPILEDADDDEQPEWNIWEYNHQDGSLHRVINDDILAAKGHDVSPRYLANDDIVFSSSRQRTSNSIRVLEGKDQFEGQNEDRRAPAMQIHKMDSNGNNIDQLTFNPSLDRDPVILEDGRILYSRWDNFANRNSIALYRMNDDGSGNELLYGYHSHDSLAPDTQYVRPVVTGSGAVMVMAKTQRSDHFGGELLIIDIENNTEFDQSTFPITARTGQARATFRSIDIDGISTEGRYTAAFPLHDGSNRLLVAWASCRVLVAQKETPCSQADISGDEVVEADSLYGVWILDPSAGTQLPIVLAKNNEMISDVAVLQERTAPAVQASGNLDAGLVEEQAGVLHIHSVYDMDGTASQDLSVLADPMQTTADNRPVRFLRIVKSVSIPDRDVLRVPNTAFGRSTQQLMREILGTVPVEPDGSVMVKVPANVPLTISLLDKNGRRVSGRHQNWLSVRPGETVECKGCHTVNSRAPHGRYAAQAPSANPGAPFSNVTNTGTTGQTMAQINAAIDLSVAQDGSLINGPAELSTDLSFTDIWNPTPEAGYQVSYADLLSASPASTNCQTSWSFLCRTTIHFAEHIAPVFTRERTWNNPATTLDENKTCTSCHSYEDDMQQSRIPDAQLDLTDRVSLDEQDHLASYRELLFNDNAQEIIDGSIVDILEDVLDANGDPVMVDVLDGQGNPVMVNVTENITDAQGNPVCTVDMNDLPITNPDGSCVEIQQRDVMENVLDVDGNPVCTVDVDDQPITNPDGSCVEIQQQVQQEVLQEILRQTIPVAAILSVNGANTSSRFFDLFESGTHSGWLDAVELRMISAWLDIGGQYYNDPYRAVQQ